MLTFVEIPIRNSRWAQAGLYLVRFEGFELGPDEDGQTVRILTTVHFAICTANGFHPGRYASEDDAVAVIEALIRQTAKAGGIEVNDAGGQVIIQDRGAFETAARLSRQEWQNAGDPVDVLDGEALTAFLEIPVGTGRRTHRHGPG